MNGLDVGGNGGCGSDGDDEYEEDEDGLGGLAGNNNKNRGNVTGLLRRSAVLPSHGTYVRIIIGSVPSLCINIVNYCFLVLFNFEYRVPIKSRMIYLFHLFSIISKFFFYFILKIT